MHDRALELAKQLGWNQAQLARLLGVHESRFSKWRSGQGEPSATHVRDMARILGVTADFLLNGEEAEPALAMAGLTQDDRAVLQIVRELGLAEARRRLLLALPEISSPYEIDPAVEHARRAKAAINLGVNAKKSG